LLNGLRTFDCRLLLSFLISKSGLSFIKILSTSDIIYVSNLWCMWGSHQFGVGTDNVAKFDWNPESGLRHCSVDGMGWWRGAGRVVVRHLILFTEIASKNARLSGD